MEDRVLLQRFVREDSQEAFAALTARYLNLVYAVCRRELADTETAEDVTQAVFLILARKAPNLGRNVVLSGWLFQTARFAAKNARLQAQRRRHYEEKAAMAIHPQATSGEPEWTDLEPLLNQSLAALRSAERDCILLRFFQGLSYAEVSTSLGISEEAARKRVTRSIEKMRHFFTKNGVIVPGAALTNLLTAHSAKVAPAACKTAIAHLMASVLVGHSTAAFVGSHAYQLSEGVLKAMKIAKMKVLTGTMAIAIVGGAVSYGMLHGQAPDQKTAYRTVILTGKARYEDGKPAGGVHIGAQLQLVAEGSLLEHEKLSGPPSERMKQVSWNETQTKSDGTYKLAVGADIPYNIEVFPVASGQNSPDDNGWVAASAEGVSGHKNQVVSVPMLVLTRGVFVTGTVTDKITGMPLADIAVGGFGAARPETSSANAWAHTDAIGHYRMRVIQGNNSLYIADNRYNGLDDDRARAKGLMKPIIAGAQESAKVDFLITPK